RNVYIAMYRKAQGLAAGPGEPLVLWSDARAPAWRRPWPGASAPRPGRAPGHHPLPRCRLRCDVRQELLHELIWPLDERCVAGVLEAHFTVGTPVGRVLLEHRAGLRDHRLWRVHLVAGPAGNRSDLA